MALSCILGWLGGDTGSEGPSGMAASTRPPPASHCEGDGGRWQNLGLDWSRPCHRPLHSLLAGRICSCWGHCWWQAGNPGGCPVVCPRVLDLASVVSQKGGAPLALALRGCPSPERLAGRHSRTSPLGLQGDPVATAQCAEEQVPTTTAGRSRTPWPQSCP